MVPRPMARPQIWRAYVTDTKVADMFRTRASQVSRVSTYDDRAGELIKTIKRGDYQYAQIMVLNENVNVNGHDRGENTPLTDAAKRGDSKAIEFLVTKLKANPHASCDCPHHKTALHYASENNHKDAVQMLLKLGANPNVLDSRKYKPADVAVSADVKELLETVAKSQCVLTGLKKTQQMVDRKI